MGSAVLAYSFLKAIYGKEVLNPVDAIIPLVKRALMRFDRKTIDRSEIKRRINISFGLDIPLNIIHYTLPKLVNQGVLVFHTSKRVYVLSNPNYVHSEILEVEKKAKDQYARVIQHLHRVLIDHDKVDMTPDDLLEDWLDNSSLSFLGSQNPAFGAGKRDKDVNRIMYFSIKEHNHSEQYLTDLIDIALGDALYRAITSITEYETEQPEEFTFRTRMDDVVAYFDTRFVIRTLGFSNLEFKQAPDELLTLCKQTGCKIRVFAHNVGEIQRVIRAGSGFLNRALSGISA